MDINTLKGQKTLEDERIAARLFESNYPMYKYVETDKTQPIPYDATIFQGEKPVAIVETKCRYDMTLHKLMNERGGEWLVTFDKIEKCVEVAKKNGTPFYGFLYLPVEKTLLTVRIWGTKTGYGKLRIVNDLATRRTVNDANKVYRRNAMIDVSDARVYRG